MKNRICIPWTKATCPLKEGEKLKYIEFNDKYKVTIEKITEDGIICQEIPYIPFEVLRNYFIMLDSTPCGTYYGGDNAIY